MTERSIGVILRTRPFTETSLIVNWLTPDLGRLSTVAKGARRPKSPFRGKLDLFYEAEFSFDRSRRSELHTLREISLKETHAPLRHELAYLQQASYGAALVEQTTEKETPLANVFDLTRTFLAALPELQARPQAVLAFELKLLNELGLAPNLAASKLTPGTQEVAKVLQGSDWSATARLRLSKAQTVELRQFLHGFMIFHLERLPQGRTAALGAAEQLPN